METIINIKKISLIFFLITGLLHLSSSIFIANGSMLKEMLIINKLMDAPFILTALLYGFSSLRIALTKPESSHKSLDLILAGIITIIILGLIAINIFFNDLQR